MFRDLHSAAVNAAVTKGRQDAFALALARAGEGDSQEGPPAQLGDAAGDHNLQTTPQCSGDPIRNGCDLASGREVDQLFSVTPVSAMV